MVTASRINGHRNPDVWLIALCAVGALCFDTTKSCVRGLGSAFLTRSPSALPTAVMNLASTGSQMSLTSFTKLMRSNFLWKKKLTSERRGGRLRVVSVLTSGNGRMNGRDFLRADPHETRDEDPFGSTR